MSRYGIAGQSYSYLGEPLSGGLLHFYESGTSDPKDTFSDVAETTPNTNPVVLDASGIQPDIFFTGTARVVIAKADGTVILTTDPVGQSATLGGLDDWDTTRLYGDKDLAKGSNGLYYQSIQGSNIANNPISSPTFWMEVRFVNNYNINNFYRAGDIVMRNNRLWVSLISSNVNNTPETNPAYWRPLDTELWADTTVKTGPFTAVAGRHYLCDTQTVGAFTATLPASPVAGDRISFTDYTGYWNTNNLTLGRNGNDIAGDASDLVCDVNFATVVIQYDSSRGWVLI